MITIDRNTQLGGGMDTALGGMGNDLITATGSGNDLLFGNEGSDTIQAGNGNNTIVGGQDSTDGADFITSGSGIQAAAQTLINGTGDAYAFVADGVDGFLFTTGGTGTAITDAVKLAGAGAVNAVQAADIAHGPLA